MAKAFLWLIWLVLSLCWMVLALMPVLMSFGDPQQLTLFGHLLHLAMIVGFMFGPPGVLAGLVYGITKLLSQGGSQVAAIFPFWAVLRIALWLTVGATGAVQVLANDGDLASASGKHMLGLNAFWWIGLPCALVAIGAAIWARLPAGGTPRSNTVAVIRTMLSPFKWFGDVVYEAAYEDQTGAVTATSKKRKAA